MVSGPFDVGRSVRPVAKESGLLHRPWAFGPAVLGFAMLAIYLTLIVGLELPLLYG